MSPSAWFWNAAGLFLLFVRLLQVFLPGRKGFFFAMLGAATLSLAPFFGHQPRYWLSGLTPNVSVPLVVLLIADISARAGWRPFFRPREWRAAFVFGAVAAIALYPSALGLGLRNFDSYSLGWPWLDWRVSFVLFGSAAAASAFLVWRGNRFGWVPAVCAAALFLGLQESRNFWDYIVDPLYAVASLLACAWLLLKRQTTR